MIVRLHASLEELVQNDEEGGEFWLARDLQGLQGYAKWENFAKVVERSITARRVSGYDPADHSLDVRKMVDLGSGATRAIDDIALTRYAGNLIAQSGDSSKEAIAFAQTYFAVHTRKQALIEQRIAEVERPQEAGAQREGTVRHHLHDGHGVIRIYFSQASRRRMERTLGHHAAGLFDRFLSAYRVESTDGQVITRRWRTGRLRRRSAQSVALHGGSAANFPQFLWKKFQADLGTHASTWDQFTNRV